MIRLLLAITCCGFVGCGLATQNRDKDVGMLLTAECGNCQTCKLTVEGEGTEDTENTRANIEEGAMMD